MNNSVEAIHLAGATLEHQHHICAFFHSQDEEYQVLLPFIKEGIESGQRAFHVVDPGLQPDHRQRLQKFGLNAAELEANDQLEIRVWADAYLRSNGCFDMNDMIALIQDVLKEGKRKGFPITRLVAHMEWALENAAGVEDIIEYESRLNYVLPQFNDPVICVYDLARFSAGTIIDILRTHPMVILGRTLQVNPFYMAPDEFIAELHARVKRPV